GGTLVIPDLQPQGLVIVEQGFEGLGVGFGEVDGEREVGRCGHGIQVGSQRLRPKRRVRPRARRKRHRPPSLPRPMQLRELLHGPTSATTSWGNWMMRWATSCTSAAVTAFTRSEKCRKFSALIP